MRRVLALIALAFLVVSGTAFGQAQRGSIDVTVTDGSGAAIPGASVNAISDETLTRRTVFTDDSGKATIISLDPAKNYVVTVSLEGFQTQKFNTVEVAAGQNRPLAVQLGLSEITEELIVTAEAPLVDVTKTQAGENITLQLTESLPTTRSYQGYLQLVPGVQDAIGNSSNPASRSGINYSDVRGTVGSSSDNLYYFDGINVTDRTTGTFGANLNTEIIQEQSVLTGGIPAEFVGAPGLISNVVTKSGGNQFSGSVNFYYQDDSLVEDNDHFANSTFKTSDAAITIGGPVVRDKAWFFGSFRNVEEEQEVIDEQDVFLRTVTTTQDQGFGKLTWAITDSDVLSGIYLTDPLDRDGDLARSRPNSADRIREQGGERYSLGYNRVWGSAAIELGYTDHEGDLNLLPINRDPLNAVVFRPTDNPTSAQETLGGSGTDLIENRFNELARASVEYLFDSGWGDHSVKVGYELGESGLVENDQTVGDPPATWQSITNLVGGTVGLCEVIGTCAAAPYSSFDFGASADDYMGFRNNLSAGNMQMLLGLWDDNSDGFLSDQEITDNMTFSSSAGNPNGQVNYTRDLQIALGISDKRTEFWQAYIQDGWQYGKLSVNAGLRAEQWDHIADNGDDISDFDTAIAPRLSVSYDLRGDGRSSIGAYYGRYFDAVRNNMTDFAGSLSSRVVHEQVWLQEAGEFTTFRVRGGLAQQDGFFAPQIETPYTDEIQLQFKQDLGRNMMGEINLIDRETSDVMEDYAALYYNAAVYGTLGDVNAPGSFFLGPGFFGYNTLADVPTNLNFLIATLPPEAYRDWQGVELVFRKRYSDNWQLLASYNFADAEANTNSDSNADGAGDVLFLDPRAPGRQGIQPGLVEHLFKVHGSYDWDNNFQVGGSYRWNSGVTLNRSGTQAFARNLPDRVDAADRFPSNGLPGTGFDDQWISGDAIGFIEGSNYGVLDLRAAYLWTINDRLEADFFLDVFNVVDDQQTIRVQDLENGGDGFAFLEGIDFVQPRRYFLGARLRF